MTTTVVPLTEKRDIGDVGDLLVREWRVVARRWRGGAMWDWNWNGNMGRGRQKQAFSVLMERGHIVVVHRARGEFWELLAKVAKRTGTIRWKKELRVALGEKLDEKLEEAA